MVSSTLHRRRSIFLLAGHRSFFFFFFLPFECVNTLLISNKQTIYISVVTIKQKKGYRNNTNLNTTTKEKRNFPAVSSGELRRLTVYDYTILHLSYIYNGIMFTTNIHKRTFISFTS
jgi:hypothetical protein